MLEQVQKGTTGLVNKLEINLRCLAQRRFKSLLLFFVNPCWAVVGKRDST